MKHSSLMGWAEAYIRYKDSIQRRIAEVQADNDSKKITVKRKDGQSDIYLCIDRLSGSAESIRDEKIVCLNTVANLDWLVKSWDILKKSRNVFIFVNPDASESWSVHPSMHDVVTERASLKTGLKALFDTVPEVK